MGISGCCPGISVLRAIVRVHRAGPRWGLDTVRPFTKGVFRGPTAWREDSESCFVRENRLASGIGSCHLACGAPISGSSIPYILAFCPNRQNAAEGFRVAQVHGTPDRSSVG